jgi:hypothetical protein
MWIVKHEHKTPPGGWRYIVEETGTNLRGTSLDSLVGLVKSHCIANGLPFTPHSKQVITNSICNANPDFCLDANPSAFTLAARFGAAMMSWAASGFKVCSQDEYQDRHDTCEACEYWNGSSAFGYGRCKKCGCTGLKLFLRTEKCPANKWKEL